MTGWRKVCDVEQGGGPFRPGKLKGRSGVGVVVISSQQGFLVEERKIPPPTPDFHTRQNNVMCAQASRLRLFLLWYHPAFCVAGRCRHTRCDIFAFCTPNMAKRACQAYIVLNRKKTYKMLGAMASCRRFRLG